jgi:hypothetical protein
MPENIIRKESREIDRIIKLQSLNRKRNIMEDLDIDGEITLKVPFPKFMTGINWLIIESTEYFKVICGEFLDYPSDY